MTHKTAKAKTMKPKTAKAKTMKPKTAKAKTMKPDKAKRSSVSPVVSVVVMCLYIADNAPNSVLAAANLKAICNEHMKGKFSLEVVDVLEYPQRALADGILVTPSLAKLSPLPTARIVGNLSDRSAVLLALGMK